MTDLPVITVPVVSAAALAVLGLVILSALPRFVGSKPQRAAAVVFAVLAIAGPLSLPGIRHAVDSGTGVPDLGILLGHLSGLFAMIAVLELAASAFSAGQKLLRGTQLAFTLVMTCLVALFLVIPRRLDQPDFGLWHVHDATVITYQMLFQTCLGIGLLFAVVTLTSARRSARRGPLRRALLLLSLGAGTGLGYVACRMWYILANGLRLVTQVYRPVYGTVTFLLLWLALAFTGAGALVRVVYVGARYVRYRLAYHRLGGLWATLTAAVPGTVLEQPPRVLLFRTLRRRLYRRIIEIRDAQMELSSHVPADKHRAAEAALLALGIDDRATLDAFVLHLGLRFHHDKTAQPHNTEPRTTDATLETELADVLQLQAAMADPAITRAVTHVLGAE